LQNRVDAMLALTEARAAMYADQKEGAHEFQVNTLAEERAAIYEGCHALPPGSAPPPADGKEGPPPLPRPAYPKTMVQRKKRPVACSALTDLIQKAEDAAALDDRTSAMKHYHAAIDAWTSAE
jgi:hypothetical protein